MVQKSSQEKNFRPFTWATWEKLFTKGKKKEIT